MYGKREELANVRKVFVAADGNVELAARRRGCISPGGCRPLKRDKGHAFTETWMYATTQGTMRLVFGGDRLQSIVFEKKK